MPRPHHASLLGVSRMYPAAGCDPFAGQTQVGSPACSSNVHSPLLARGLPVGACLPGDHREGGCCSHCVVHMLIGDDVSRLILYVRFGVDELRLSIPVCNRGNLPHDAGEESPTKPGLFGEIVTVASSAREGQLWHARTAPNSELGTVCCCRNTVSAWLAAHELPHAAEHHRRWAHSPAWRGRAPCVSAQQILALGISKLQWNLQRPGSAANLLGGLKASGACGGAKRASIGHRSSSGVRFRRHPWATGRQHLDGTRWLRAALDRKARFARPLFGAVFSRSPPRLFMDARLYSSDEAQSELAERKQDRYVSSLPSSFAWEV